MENTPMNEEDVRKKCEAFLQSLGVPAFIVFGWKKADLPPKEPGGKPQAQYGMVSSYFEMPTKAVVKGMTWALNDIVNRTM